jgi:hypothetical protein
MSPDDRVRSNVVTVQLAFVTQLHRSAAVGGNTLRLASAAAALGLAGRARAAGPRCRADRLLAGSDWTVWSAIAANCALAKFALLAAGALYSVAGTAGWISVGSSRSHAKTYDFARARVSQPVLESHR